MQTLAGQTKWIKMVLLHGRTPLQGLMLRDLSPTQSCQIQYQPRTGVSAPAKRSSSEDDRGTGTHEFKKVTNKGM